MRSIHFSSTILVACLLSRAAFAVDAPLAPAPALPPLAAQAPDTASSGTRFVEPEDEKHGMVINFGVGLGIPSGSYFAREDMSSFGVGLASTLTIGTYLSPHVGVIGGFHFSTRHQGASGCVSSDHCGGFTYQFPVLIQYAFQDRKEGAFLQGGLGFSNTYTLFSDGGSLTFSSPFEYKLGAGYRFSQATFVNGLKRPSRESFELYVNLDFGQFSHVNGAVTFHHLDDDINSQLRETHYMLELGFAVHWTP